MKLWEWHNKERMIKSASRGHFGLTQIVLGLFITVGSYGDTELRIAYYCGVILLISGIFALLFRKKLANKWQQWPEVDFKRGSKAGLIMFMPLLIISFFDIDKLWPSFVSYTVSGFFIIIGLLYYIFYHHLPRILK